MEKLLEFKPFKALMKMISECMDFKGRTSRNEYWWAVLGIFLIELAIGIVFGILKAILPHFLDVILNLLSNIISLAAAFLGVSMSIRRLHDTNKPGWWLLLSLTAIGGIVPLVFCILDGQKEDNQYGPVPTSIV